MYGNMDKLWSNSSVIITANTFNEMRISNRANFFYGKLCECVCSPFCVYVCSIVLEFSLYQSLWFSFEEVLMRVGYHHHQFISFTFNNDVGAVDEGREKNFCTNEFRILFFLQKVFMNTLSPNLMMIQLEINSNGMKTVNAHEEEFRLKK